jgi:hypothetical protein
MLTASAERESVRSSDAEVCSAVKIEIVRTSVALLFGQLLSKFRLTVIDESFNGIH